MVTLLTITTTTPCTKTIRVDSKLNYISSDRLGIKESETVTTEVLTEETKTVPPPIASVSKQVPKKSAISNTNEEQAPIETVPKQELPSNNSDSITAVVGDIFTGKMSGYGADIGDYTSSGYYIKDTITYYDKTYKELRILAAGKEYPFGTIVKVSNTNVGSFMAIVLDRGPDIGRSENKKFAFDLLFKTSKEAYQYGVSKKAEFEIIRVGWNI